MKQSQDAADFQLGAFSGPEQPPLPRSKQVPVIIGVDSCLMRAFSVQVITPLSFKEQGGVIDICSFLFHERLSGCGPPEIAVFIDRCTELNIYEAV